MDLRVNGIIHDFLTGDCGPRGDEGAGPVWLRLLTEEYYKGICQTQWHKVSKMTGSELKIRTAD